MGTELARGRKKPVRTAVTVSALALATLVIGSVTVHLPSAAHASSAPAHSSGISAAKTAKKPAQGEPTPTPTPTAEAPAPNDGPQPLVHGTVIDTVSYGPHIHQRMDVWHQPDQLKRPGVFVIHGGWWSSGDKKLMTEVSRSYAEQGYTVFNINYRLSTAAPWPAQRTDTLDAIATARRHAALWSFDPNDYVVIGFSAGGHLATAVGTYRDGLPGLRGVVGISPVVSPMMSYAEGTDSLDLNKRKLRTSAIKLAGGCGPTGKCSRMWASMEVSGHVSRGDAPVLTAHSEDEFVSVEQSLQLKARLRQVGVDMTVLTEPGTGHSAPLYRMPGLAEKVQQWVAGKLLEPLGR
jgi:acetyl esterase/lipase